MEVMNFVLCSGPAPSCAHTIEMLCKYEGDRDGKIKAASEVEMRRIVNERVHMYKWQTRWKTNRKQKKKHQLYPNTEKLRHKKKIGKSNELAVREMSDLMHSTSRSYDQ